MRLSWKGYPQGAVHGVREPVRRLVSRVCIRLWMTAVGDVLKTPIIEVSPRTVRVRRERVWVTPGLLSPIQQCRSNQRECLRGSDATVSRATLQELQRDPAWPLGRDAVVAVRIRVVPQRHRYPNERNSCNRGPEDSEYHRPFDRYPAQQGICDAT